uniref:Uncharacterized protein n=1 Tax=Chelativorans sp. (strain BNC1) TaxID=266779 RepID=Q11LV9_CHESB
MPTLLTEARVVNGSVIYLSLAETVIDGGNVPEVRICTRLRLDLAFAQALRDNLSARIAPIHALGHAASTCARSNSRSIHSMSRSYVFTVNPAPFSRTRLKNVLSLIARWLIVCSDMPVRLDRRSAVSKSRDRSSCSIVASMRISTPHASEFLRVACISCEYRFRACQN